MTMTGTTKLDWNTTGDRPTYRYEADFMRLGTDLINNRRSPPADTATVFVKRLHAVTRQIILLPDAGKGFSIEGDPIDETIGTVRYQRSASLVGNRFEATASTISGRSEIPVSVAKVADERSDDLHELALYLRLPPISAAAAITTDTATAANRAVTDLLEDGKLEQARGLIDARLATNPRDAGALALRGLLSISSSRLDLAGRDFDAALAIDRASIPAIEGKARLLIAQDRLDDALMLFDRAVLLEPERGQLYGARGLLREWSGDPDGALSDYEIALTKEPRNVWLRNRKVVLLNRTGKADAAAAFATKLLEQDPDDLYSIQLLVRSLVAQKQFVAARKLLADRIKAKPSQGLYEARLYFDLAASPDEALADLLAIIAFDPTQELPPHTLQTFAADKARLARLQAAYAAAAAKPGADGTRIALQTARLSLVAGDPSAFDQAYAALIADPAPNGAALNEVCWGRATQNVGIEAARQACEAAIRNKRHPYFVDSLGLVELRSGNAAAALRLYDEAVALMWNSASTLFARGLTRQRLGDSDGALRDFARARITEPEIERDFAGYGLKP